MKTTRRPPGVPICRATIVCAVMGLLAATPVVPQEPTLPPFDFDRWARFVVQELFAAQPHERYVLMADPSYYPEFVDALRAEFLEARAVELGTMLFDGARLAARRRIERPRQTDSIYRRAADSAMRNLIEQADMFLWLPLRYGTGEESGDRRLFEHLVDGTRARGLHFHWVWGHPGLRTGEDRAVLDSLAHLYAKALDIDYAALSAHQDRIIDAMRGRVVRLTTEAGTDLRMRVSSDAWFHKNDGRMDQARAAVARSVRDREMELPAGALRFIPNVQSVEGVLVGPSWRGARDVRFAFTDGRVTSVRAGEHQARVGEAWERETGDKDRIAEIVIGTNPVLPVTGPGGSLPYFGYGAGVVRIALGENWESGGSNRSSLEAWFWLTDATVTANGITIVERGRLVLP